MNKAKQNALLPVEDALAYLIAKTNAVSDTETIALSDALNAILAKDVFSPFPVPNYTNSAMDGYAFKAGEWDGQSELPVCGESFAGNPYTGEIPAGHCIRITTGAQLPDDCDSVVIQENVTRRQQSISINSSVERGDNIRLAGSDLQQGERVLSAGTRINAIHIGLLASLGLAELCVYRKITVGVFSTGDELVPVGQTLEKGQVFDSNRLLLIAMLSSLRLQVKDYGLLADEPEAIERVLRQAAEECDAIITSGGVSVGDADYTGELLHRLATVQFHKVALKPGKPFAFGKLNNAYIFGLPGNPVSSAVSFQQLALPALRRLMGERCKPDLALTVRCDSALRKHPGRTEFQRGILSLDEHGQLCVQTTGPQSSAVFSSMAKANCYIRLGHERGNVSAGELVQVLPFH